MEVLTDDYLKNIKGTKDYCDGVRDGVEWAENYGDCSMVKFFVAATKEAEDSYIKEGDDLSV